MPDEPALTVAPQVEHPRSSVAGADATTVHDAPVAALPASTATVRYVLGAEIARGGMGAVYRATDAVFGREVAVKVLLNTYAPESGIARRFHDEARITGQLQHPGIPPAHDLGTLSDGRPFLAMKLIKGDTLHDLLTQRSDPAADRGRLLAVFEGVCQAMAYAHAHGVVHRDLKPSNIMVGAFGEVQVMDWGLAKVLDDGRPCPADDPDVTAAASAMTSTRDSEELLTQAGSVLGTPAYMPPEQATGAIHEVDRRSDVFGLGGILAAVLTGQPPFVGDTARTTWVQASRGEVQECFQRLERCEADPELVALTKRCLAPKREDRPADAGAVANEVAALRAAADDRARRAEVELATTATATGERRKRRRVWLVAVAALAVALFGGLGAVLAVQRRANADMAAANGKLAAKNDALEAERVKVEQRFDMARRAIAAFHTTIDEQPELGNEAFRPLRRKLLTAAAGFYRQLEELLADDPDPKSRAALADGYFQLAELASKIGDQTETLAVYRKALALRRELAAVPAADGEARLAVSMTVRQVGQSLAATGDTAGALRAYEEARDAAAALEAEAPTDAVRQALADSQYAIGAVLSRTGQSAEAMAAHQKARDLRRSLVDANPAVPAFQNDLAQSHLSIGIELQDRMGKPAEALAAFREALTIRQNLAAAHPTVIAFESDLGKSYYNIGIMLRIANQPEEALEASEKARDIYQKLADANPAVTKFQSELARSQQSIGWLLGRSGKRKESLAADQKALMILQKLADAHPAVTEFQSDLAQSHYNIGRSLKEMGQTWEALAAKERAMEIYQKLADAYPAETQFQLDVARSHHYIGDLLQDAGQPAEALAAYYKCRDLYQKLADAQPTVPGYRADLASTNNQLGRLLAKDRRFTEAFAALDAGLALREKLAAADAKTTQYTSQMGLSHAYRGWARMRAGQPKEAAADLLKAVELWGETTDPDAEDFFEQARALALLAILVHDPNSGVTSDEAKGFADRSAAALANAVKAGWVQPAELREPDFDAVRDRTDFRKLQAELEVGAP